MVSSHTLENIFRVFIDDDEGKRRELTDTNEIATHIQEGGNLVISEDRYNAEQEQQQGHRTGKYWKIKVKQFGRTQGGHILQTPEYMTATSYTIWLQGCSLACKGCWNNSLARRWRKKKF